MRVLKFGGTSVGGASQIKNVAGIVDRAAQESKIVVVVSAMAGVTDHLERAVRLGESQRVTAFLSELHHAILCDLSKTDDQALCGIEHQLRVLQRSMIGGKISRSSPEFRDSVLATGERLSVELVAAALRRRGRKAVVIDGSELLLTNNDFGRAEVLFEASRYQVVTRLVDGIDPGTIPVVTGFIGKDEEGRTTTLGRGGSDQTASLLAAMLDAERVEIWTDVNGILSGSPRIVPEAATLKSLSFDEAAELAHFGAKVLCPQTVAPVAARNIPIRICNSFDPPGPSTNIVAPSFGNPGVRAVTGIEKAVLFTVRQTGLIGNRPGRFIDVITDKVPLLMCQATADGRWLLVVREHEAERISENLRHPEVSTQIEPDLAVLTLVGSELLRCPELIEKALEALASNHVEVRSVMSSSPTSVSLLFGNTMFNHALKLVHDALNLGHIPESNVLTMCNG